jgi:HK97 family phage major capsid protein
MPAGGLSASPFATLMGRPVVPAEYCQTVGTVGDIILADMSQYQMIEKGGIQQASSIHVQFVYDETVFRFVYRCDGESKWNSALTPKNGTNTVSPFVALASRD